MSDVELRARNSELVTRLAAATDDREALVEELALANLAIARSVARRYTGGSQLGPDLEQAACLELFRAARRFDPCRGHEFLAYAIPCMNGAVRRYLRDFAWVIRPPRPVQVRHQMTEGLRSHVEEGVEVETCFLPHSLDVTWPGAAESVGSTLVDEDDSTWQRTEARLLLWPHLRSMSPRAREVLRLRYVEDRTQQEIADQLGLSQYHVSRLLARYLGELRRKLADAA